MQQTPIFEFAGASFESPVLDVPTFGVIRLNASETAALCENRMLDFQIRIDNSGSMSDACSDGRTKMQHVNFAVSQILRKLGESSIPATTNIKTFDETIVQIIDGSLNADTVEEMVSRVNKIFPNGGTNIYSVLDLEEKSEHTSEDRVFILLSDGQDTTGASREKLIRTAARIDPNTNVIMIGVGNDHDANLFKGIVNQRISARYTPVSNVEDIAIAISELIYGVLNKILKRTTITVANGEIYSWSANKWVSSITADDIVVGRKKTFNVRSSTPELFRATVEGFQVATRESFMLEMVDAEIGADLTYEKFRHGTMELLGESALADQMNTSEIRALKLRLKNKMIELKAFMDENKLRDDKRYQILCDDIFMCHQTMGSVHGTMYAMARQTSQGTQSIYTNQRDLTVRLSHMNTTPRMARGIADEITFDDDDDMPPIPTMRREVSHCIYQMSQEEEGINDMLATIKRRFQPQEMVKEEKEEDDITDDAMSNHQMLASDDSPYANEMELAFIREVSKGSSI